MKLPKVMRRVTAALGLALLLLLPPALGGSEGAETLAITAGTCFYHFAMRLAVGALVPRVLKPNAAERPCFRQRHIFRCRCGVLQNTAHIKRHGQRLLSAYRPL